MKYIKQIKSVLIHKWYVLRAGIEITKVPLWRLLIHDYSKFSLTELKGYADNIGGVNSKEKWSIAWLHHLHYNPHHPEHWLLTWRGNPDFYNDIAESVSKFVCVLPMPETYVREMLADMHAVSYIFSRSWDISEWFNQNGPDMILHTQTKEIIKKVMKEIGYELDNDIQWTWGRKIIKIIG